MAWTASFNRTDTYIDLETDISLNDFSITFENVIFNIATPSGQSQVLSGSQSSFNYAIGVVPDQWFVRIAGVYYYFDFTSIGSPVNNRGTFTVTRVGDQLTADFNGTSETVTSTTLPMFFGGFGLFNMSFLTSVHVPDGEIGDTTLNDGTSDAHKWDYTNSDHNSGTDPVTNPFTVTDPIGGTNGTGINMTDANWIDLGGGGTVVEFTFSINTVSSVSIESVFVISSDFQISTASSVSFASVKVQQSNFDITSQSSINIESAKIQSSIFEIDSSSTFSMLTGDTNIVEFTFSINSQSSLSADSAKVQSSAFDIESQSNTGIESAKVQASEFNVDSGANVHWSASAIQGRAFAIDSESVFTVVVEGGEPVFIIGLTLELSSDIITLELSSGQEIRELA